MTLPLKHPFSSIVAGPSMAGKTHWVFNVLANRKVMIEPFPEKVYFCYKEYQKSYDTLVDVELHQGLIQIDLLDTSKRNLIIFDDLMTELNVDMVDLFTKFVHHRNLSAVFITQNIFHKSPHLRTMNLNASYLVLFKNPRDINQISYLSRQMYPKGQTKFMLDSFKDATLLPHGYLLIDLKQDTYDMLRLRTGIFPHEKTYIYVPKHASTVLERYTKESSNIQN